MDVWIQINKDFGTIVAILTWAGSGCKNGPKYPSWAGLADTWSNQTYNLRKATHFERKT